MFESFWPTFLLILAPWVLGVSTWILFERRSPLSTLAWIFGLSAVPVVGLIIYFLFGPRRFERRKFRHRLSREATTRAGKSMSQTIVAGSSDEIHHVMHMCEQGIGIVGTPRLATLEFFFDGDSKYRAMVDAIEGATHHIHMEYYIWEPDAIGKRIRDALARKAKEGVEVRVLIDSFGSSSANSRFWKPLRKAGGEVEVFNSMQLWKLTTRLANFRSHRKILVVDGTIGFTGGMNIVEYHAAEFCGAKAWRDTHMRLEGDAVRGLQLVFFEGWHYATGSAPDDAIYLPETAPLPGAAKVQVISSGPDESANIIHKLFVSSIASAKERVLISTAYFIPGEAIFTAMATAILRGVEVHVLIPAKSDVKIVEAATRSYYRDLLELGVKVYEFGPPMLHSKTMVVDDTIAIVGSANVDRRSFELNFEVGAVIYESSVCSQLADAFAKDLERAVPITPEILNSYSFVQRLGHNFARLFSPLI